MGRVERKATRDEQPPAVIEEKQPEETNNDGEDFKNFVTADRVGASFGVTLNTGNFSSVKMELWGAMDLPPDMTPQQARKLLMAELQAEVREFARPIKAKKEQK